MHALLLALPWIFAAHAQDANLTTQAQTYGTVTVGQPLPSFSGYDMQGAVVSARQYIDGAPAGGFIVSFFATYCGPCRMGMPIIQEAVQSRPGWHAVFIDLGEPTQKVAPFLQQLGIQQRVILDESGFVGKRFGVSESLPKTFVVDSKGVVRAIFTEEGSDFREQLKAVVDKIAP
jgi:thiol-disulfide isomerase/thioredoxin